NAERMAFAYGAGPRTDKKGAQAAGGVADRAHGVTDRAPAVTDPAHGVTDRAPAVTDPAHGVTDRAPAVTDPAPNHVDPELPPVGGAGVGSALVLFPFALARTSRVPAPGTNFGIVESSLFASPNAPIASLISRSTRPSTRFTSGVSFVTAFPSSDFPVCAIDR